MLKRLLAGTVLGGLVMFAWGAVSWMLLPWHQPALQSFANEEVVAAGARRRAPGFSRLWYVLVLAVLIALVAASWAGAKYSTSLQVKAFTATSERELKELLKNTWATHDSGVLAAIAKNRKASPGILRQVSQHSFEAVRLELADNPNTPADVLRDIARSDSEVASRVAVHPNAPRDVLRSLNISRPSAGFTVPVPRTSSQDFFRGVDTTPGPSPSNSRQQSGPSDLLNRMPRQSSDRQPR